ncbi:hypothetical protein CPC08DRAFT_712490 [Agrocybe pediades]|nr:hypothetical protein CPC08DRAFT_712490 [Agrocybe pediades]
MLQTPIYSPVVQIDEEKGAMKKLLGQDSHFLAQAKGSRLRNRYFCGIPVAEKKYARSRLHAHLLEVQDKAQKQQFLR